MAELTLIQAACAALELAMADERVTILGEDVATGGPFGLTKNLAQKFGAARVRNTPISEASFMGVGIGMALAGGRPFVDVMFNDFMTVASDQLFNHAAKIWYMSGNKVSVPLTVWTVAGAGSRWGAQHSQRLDGWFTQVPGLKVLSPSTAEAMTVSVHAAIFDDDPVLLLVDRSLLYSKATYEGANAPAWTPRVVRTGNDITLVTTGRLVHMAREVAARSSVDIEVIDLQRLAPLTTDVIATSVEKTSRLVVAHDEVSCGAFTTQLVRAIYDRCFYLLDGPIVSVNAPATPVPAAADLEDAYLVDAGDLEAAIERAVRQ